MLQRVQTIYLLGIVALMAATLFLPLAIVQGGSEFYTFDAAGLYAMSAEPELLYPTWGLLGLTAIILLVALFTIFLFKKRILQVRLCVFNALLILSFYGLFVFFTLVMKNQMEGGMSLNLRIAVIFPLVSLILDYLAIRNIGADEALVRSLERLR